MTSLGDRLLRAGLVTERELAEADGDTALHGAALVASLSRSGIDEEALAGFFLSEGYGPLLGREQLRRADPAALGRLPAKLASEFLAYPVRATPGGLLIALADPTDPHIASEVQRAVGGPIIRALARVSDLQYAIARSFPDHSASARAERDTLPDVFGLDPLHAEADEAAPSPKSPPRGSFSELPPPPEQPLELVRKKPLEEPGPYWRSTRKAPRSGALPVPAEDPDDVGSPPADIFDDRQDPLALPSPKPAGAPPHGEYGATSRRVQMGDPDDRWSNDDLSAAPGGRAEVRSGALPSRLRDERSDRQKRPPSDVGGLLTAIRGSKRREELVELTCEAASIFGRASAFLALRRGVLRGLAARGLDERSSIRNVWIPVGSPSIFRETLETGEVYRGPHGTTVADQMFRAAISSRGGELVVLPVAAGGRALAVLVVDEPVTRFPVEERLHAIAQASGSSFERLILKRKRHH